MNISSFTVRRPVLVCMVTLIVMLIGIVSFFRIPVDLMPDTSVPTLSIRARYPGVGPEEIEKLLTRPIEDALSSVEGLRIIQSSSSSGYCQVRLIFDWGADIEEAMRNVQQLIDKVERRLPDDVNKPEVRKYDPNDVPVIVFGVTAENDPILLTRTLEDEIIPILSRINGVGNVEMYGELEEEVQVLIDLKKVKALKLSVSDVSNVIRRQNYSLPAGTVATGLQREGMRISANIDNLWALQRTVVKSLDTGKVFLGDVATVKMVPAKRRSISYIDGVPGIRLAISKSPGANTVAVAKEVREVIANVGKRSDDIKFSEIFNTAIYIESAVKNVNFSVLYGGFLAITVLIFFLRNLRSTLVIGVSIPVSVIAAFALIYFNGLTLNLMTIGGLALGIGMLVDNAIVVLENIMRHRHNGLSMIDSAIKGGNEVQSSIIASTITTLIVFLPVIFMEGITSLLFKELALVVVFTMLVSLAAAIFLIPTLSSLLVRNVDDPDTHVEKGLWGVFARFLDKVEKIYIRVLRQSLKSRLWTLFICFLMLASSTILIPKIGTEFMPSADSNQMGLNMTMARGTDQEVIQQNMHSIINTIQTEFSGFVSKSIGYMRDDSENNSAYISLLLTQSSERDQTAKEISNEMVKRFSSLPGVSVRGRVSRSPFTPRLPNTSGDSVEIEIRGHDLKLFESLAIQVKEQLEEIPGVEEVHIPRYRTREEKLVKVEKIRTAELGISLQQVGDEIKAALSGVNAGYYLKDGLEYPIRLKVDGQEQMSPEDILTMTISNRSKEPIMFSNIISIVDYEGPAQIKRDNRQRIMTMGVDLSSSSGESFVLRSMEEALYDMRMPAGFSVVLGGNYQQQKESNRALLISLALVVLLVYMVMAAQFESLKHPFVIMFSVPLAAIGVLWTLYLTGTTFNMQSNMGCVMLAGIVVNNAILLVDQTNQLRTEGSTIMNALVEGGRRRLRPILMTTATTVLGLVPLALGLGDGGKAQAPMARAVMGGLLSSTFITLVLVPVIYSLFEKEKESKC